MLHFIIILLFSNVINFASLQKFDQKYHTDFSQDLQLAYIVPLDIYGKEAPQYAYKGFVRIAPRRSYPNYYDILCPTPVSYNFNLHNYFNALNQKLNDINEKFVKVWKQPDEENEQNDVEDDSSQNKSEVENLEQSKVSNSPNINNQSGVFQCKGFTCPSETHQCRISISSIQPLNMMIRNNIFCMSANDDVIDEFEKIEINPNKGSIVNVSKTFNPHGMQEAINDEIENKLKEAQVIRENKIKEMEDKMKNIFNKNFSPWDL